VNTCVKIRRHLIILKLRKFLATPFVTQNQLQEILYIDLI
jgi:hypothetical protein